MFVFTLGVRAALGTPIACTLRLPRGRRGEIIMSARAIGICGCGDLCTSCCSGGDGCVQREARNFTSLCHLHNFLPCERAARAVMQEIIARCGRSSPL